MANKLIEFAIFVVILLAATECQKHITIDYCSEKSQEVKK